MVRRMVPFIFVRRGRMAQNVYETIPPVSVFNDNFCCNFLNGTKEERVSFWLCLFSDVARLLVKDE